jgi:hypothetical protein
MNKVLCRRSMCRRRSHRTRMPGRFSRASGPRKSHVARACLCNSASGYFRPSQGATRRRLSSCAANTGLQLWFADVRAVSRAIGHGRSQSSNREERRRANFSKTRGYPILRSSRRSALRPPVTSTRLVPAGHGAADHRQASRPPPAPVTMRTSMPIRFGYHRCDNCRGHRRASRRGRAVWRRKRLLNDSSRGHLRSAWLGYISLWVL